MIVCICVCAHVLCAHVYIPVHTCDYDIDVHLLMCMDKSQRTPPVSVFAFSLEMGLYGGLLLTTKHARLACVLSLILP